MMHINNITAAMQTLEKFFVFDKIFDLFEYQDNMERLYNDLQQCTRESYEANYRFIFLHFDTDYYILNDQPGILLRNLQKILWNLDISNYFCLILSQQNLQEELDQLRVEETSDDCSIQCIQHYLQDINFIPKQTNSINPDAVEKNYICLNRRKRVHRLCLFSLLGYANLLDKGIVSYGSRE